MEKKLYDYLMSLGIEAEDIDTLRESVPGLDIIGFERAKKNISLVEEFGYPSEDISSLIYANPGFLCNDPKVLKEKLILLGENIETKLNDDPFLI